MRHHFDAVIKVKRLKTLSGNIRALQATATGEANIQPLGKDTAGLDEGVYGKSYIAYTDIDLPAGRGDYITDQNGNTFIVSDVVTREYGAFPLKELILKRTTTIT